MNNKLICPFCQQELEDAGIHSAGFYFWCTNCYMKQKEKDDNYTASPRIWQALIQAKQDLEIARSALKELITYYDHYDSFDGEISWDGVALIMRNDAHEALGQIEHFADVSNMVEHKE